MKWVISVMISLAILLITLPEELFYKRSVLRLLVRENHRFGQKTEKYQSKGAEMLVRISRILTKGISIKISPKALEKISKNLAIADLSNKIAVADFVRVKYTISFLCILYFLLFYFLNPSTMTLLFVGIMGIMGYYIPDNWLAGKAKRRQMALEKEIPSILSALAITTDAGLNLLQAVEEVTGRNPSELSKEFRKALEDIHIGISQKQAFEKMAERCGVEEINHFISVLIQALEKGSSGITMLLKEQAKASWEKRKDRAKDLAEKASIKLFMPLLLLVFPAFVIFLIGPMAFSIVEMLFKP